MKKTVVAQGSSPHETRSQEQQKPEAASANSKGKHMLKTLERHCLAFKSNIKCQAII